MENKYKDILLKSSILIVDDDDELRSIFKKTLTSFVDKVYEASNGSVALDIYYKQKPTIVITDIKMPLMDGLMFITMLRQIDKKIPIVVVSAYSDSSDLIKLTSLRLIDYLVKPIDFTNLQSAIVKCATEIEEEGLIETNLTKNCSYLHSSKSLKLDEKVISLSPNEISLLELLIENNNMLVTKPQIEDIVYKNEYVSDGALNTLVSKLRKKMGVNIINSIHSHGYILIRQF